MTKFGDEPGFRATPHPPAPSAATTLCPNTRRHHEAGMRMMRGIASYKTEQRNASYRSGVEGDKRDCDYCWPACPTCGHRERRRPSE